MFILMVELELGIRSQILSTRMALICITLTKLSLYSLYQRQWLSNGPRIPFVKDSFHVCVFAQKESIMVETTWNSECLCKDQRPVIRNRMRILSNHKLDYDAGFELALGRIVTSHDSRHYLQNWK